MRQIVLDTETTGLDPMLAELIAITISIKPNSAWMIYFAEGEDPQAKLEKLRPLFESEN